MGCFARIEYVYAQQCENLSVWQNVQINDDELLLSVLRLNGRPISPTFDVFPYQKQFLIPVSSLESVLQLGWFINIEKALVSSNNTDDTKDFCDFDIQLTNLLGTDPFFWARDDFDLYIDARALQVILGGSYAFNYELLHLNLFNDNPFPGLKTSSTVVVPIFETQEDVQPSRGIVDQYRTVTPPIINYRLNGSHNSELDSSRINANVNGFFDLFNHATELRVNANQDSTRQFLKFSKNLEIRGQDQTLDFLRYEVGDVQLQSDELIYRSKQAAGISVFNFDPNYSRSFSTVTLEETVLPGWRVQLFRNGQFVQEVFSDGDNRAVFEEVDTFYGSNLFEFKLYGPEGQQETRTKTINVGNEQLNPGRFNYLFNVSDASKRFIDQDNEEAAFDKNASALISYGLTKNATVEASIHSLQGAEQKQEYLSSALYMNFSGAAFKGQIVKDVDAGSAFFTGLNSTFFENKLRANLSLRYFNDFASDAFPASRDLKTEMRTRLNGKLAWLEGANWGLNYLHRNYNARGDDNILSINVNKNLLGGTFSTSISRNEALADETLRHTVYWSKNFSGWQVSNSLEWLPLDSEQVLNYYSNIRWPQQYTTYNETRIDYRPSREHRVELRHQLNWRQKQFNVQFGASVNNGGEWTVNFGIAGDIEYDPYNKSLNFYQPRGSNTANIRAFAFLDNNRNSQFDGGDSALSDVVISGNHAWRNFTTNQSGQVQLATTKREQAVTIDEASLPDPYMKPVDNLVLVNTHRGGINTVSLPVVTFNDIEGAVYRTKNNSSRGASDLRISLLNELSEVVAETASEVDGYFFFTQIPPGQYQLQIDPDFLVENRLTISNLPKVVDAPTMGDSIRINDLLLVDQGATEAEPEPPTTDIAKESNRYFVQLGAFKKFRSIFEVIQYLPTDEYNLKIFRQHNTAMSHVVMGGYKSIEEANRAIQKVRYVAQLKDVFISKGARYYSEGWSMEFELSDLAGYIQLSHQKVLSAEPDTLLCQLASYRSLTSIKQLLLNQNQKIFVVRRSVSGKRYYTLLGTLTSHSENCETEFSKLTPESPFPISLEKITSSLHK